MCVIISDATIIKLYTVRTYIYNRRDFAHNDYTDSRYLYINYWRSDRAREEFRIESTIITVRVSHYTAVACPRTVYIKISYRYIHIYLDEWVLYTWCRHKRYALQWLFKYFFRHSCNWYSWWRFQSRIRFQ